MVYTSYEEEIQVDSYNSPRYTMTQSWSVTSIQLYEEWGPFPEGQGVQILLEAYKGNKVPFVCQNNWPSFDGNLFLIEILDSLVGVVQVDGITTYVAVWVHPLR